MAKLKSAAPDFWRLYLFDNIQKAVDDFPPEKFMDLVFSASTIDISVVEVNIPGHFVILEVLGDCGPGEGEVLIDYKVSRADLGQAERQRLVALMKTCSLKKDQTQLKQAARALNVAL